MGKLHFIEKRTFEIPPGKKIIKAGEYMTRVDADEIIDKANREAEKILEEAREAFEIEKKKGYEAGLLEGKKSIASQMMGAVTGAVNYLSVLEEKVVEIVMSAVMKIVGEIDDEKLILKIVKNALAVVRNQKQVTLRVAPGQVKTVKNALDKILSDYPGISFIDVAGDSRLKSDGCILETDIGVVDASVDVQLSAIRKSLTQKLKGSGR